MERTDHQIFMQRCLQLAQLGRGHVAPNPMVGAVLVYEGVIIGEGYHEKYGDFHAEVNCIDSVKKELRHLVERATLYVSLEPCAHFGKTPPCTNLIILMEIPRVVIGCRDPFVEVNGKGIEKLQAAGVEVVQGVLEDECKELNKRFFTFHTKHRPYVILKWAQTGNGKMALPPLTPPTGENHAQPLAPSNSPNGGEPNAQPLLKEDADKYVGEFYQAADPFTYHLLKNFVSEHRKNPTQAEDFLWQQLRGNKLNGYVFRRQHIIGNFIVDFVCLAKKLIIEVDGLIHQLPENKMSDKERTVWLQQKGYEVIRFTNEEILFDTQTALNQIKQKIEELPFAERKIYASSTKTDRSSKVISKGEVGEWLSSPVGGNQRLRTQSGMGAGQLSRLFITNEQTNRIVHKWRSEEMAIAVGTNTALLDDPQLSTRLWPGKNPIRIVVDMDLRLPSSLQLFDATIPTIVFNTKQHTIDNSKAISFKNNVVYYQVTEDASLVYQMLNALYSMNIQSVIVEGGAYLLQSFIDEGVWDEARIIANEELIVDNGLPAPVLQSHKLLHTQTILSDTIRVYNLLKFNEPLLHH